MNFSRDGADHTCINFLQIMLVKCTWLSVMLPNQDAALSTGILQSLRYLSGKEDWFYLIYLFIYTFSTQDWTQACTHVRQAIYHFSHVPRPKLIWYKNKARKVHQLCWSVMLLPIQHVLHELNSQIKKWRHSKKGLLFQWIIARRKMLWV
jgi:hypothetical protein